MEIINVVFFASLLSVEKCGLSFADCGLTVSSLQFELVGRSHMEADLDRFMILESLEGMVQSLVFCLLSLGL
jgi:hypothetical protein